MYWRASVLMLILFANAAREAEAETAYQATYETTTDITLPREFQDITDVFWEYPSESTTEYDTTTDGTSTYLPETTIDTASTQSEATTECGTVTSQEGLKEFQGSPSSDRVDVMQDVVKGSAPWVARLYENESELICGGALINRQWIITAANCFHGNDSPAKQDLSVRIGDNNEQSKKFIQVEEIYEHEEFDLSTFKNDIALIKLASPLRGYTDYIKPICLANQTKYKELMTNGALGRVTKWRGPTEGGISNDRFTEAYTPFVGYIFCKKQFRHKKVSFTKNMFCAGYSRGGTDALLGDIGGPYSLKDETGRWYLTGVFSRKDSYGIYTRYSKYHEWVRQTITTNEMQA